MKSNICRFLLGIFFLTIFNFNITSFSLNQAGIFLSNDAFNGEISLNRDDYRTYGTGVFLQWSGGLFSELYFYGLTDRKSGLRSDQAILKTGMSFDLEGRWGRLDFLPWGGGICFGNLGGQFVQNTMHKLFSLKKVSFDYEFLSSFDPFLGFSIRYSMPLPINTGISLVPSLEITPEYSFYSGFFWDISIQTKLKNVEGDYFKLEYGYRDNGGEYSDSTLNLVLAKESGFYFRYGIQTGLLSFENIIFPDTNFSTGTITLVFSLLAGSDRKYMDPDFLIDYSLDFFCLVKEMRLSFFPGEIEFFGVSLDFSPFLDYSYGDAVNDFHSTERQIRFNQIMAGMDLPVIRAGSSFPVSFSAGIGLGVRNEKLWDLADSLDSVLTPVFQPEICLRTKGFNPSSPDSIFSGNTNYGVSLRYGIQFFLNNGVNVDYQQRLSLGLNLWCDY